MRITNPTLLRGYNRDLNRISSSKNELERKIASTRNFNRAHEAPLSAAKALNVRKSMYYNDQHTENLKVANKFYTEAETSLLQVSEKMAQIRETIIAACNTSKDTQDYKIYAQQLMTSAQELCAIFNTDSAGRSIFGGEGNEALPFSILNGSDGRPAAVLYHGVPVNAMNDYNGFPYSDDVYIDIGIGMCVDQKTHEVDSASVLRTSFNGAKVSGCGAEYGVADIDLSSVKPGRKYCFDIYADGVKKTIEFTGQGSFSDNVNAINDELKKAYKKEIRSGKNYPQMDAQGVVSLRDKDGKAVEGGIVSMMNNTTKNPRADKLVIDNDSGYTDKYRLNLSALEEGGKYTVDVTVGNVTKTIEFEAGTDNLADTENPIYREDVTVKNFQAALDAAFGEGKVNVSADDPTKGIVTSEGASVKLTAKAAEDEKTENTNDLLTVNAKTSDKVNLKTLKEGEEYSFKVNGTEVKVSVKDGQDAKTALEEALKDANVTATVNDNGTISVNGANATITSDTNAAAVGTYTEYSIDTDSLEAGKSYSLKVVVGNDVKNVDVTIPEGVDAKQALQDALKGAGVTMGDDGSLTVADGKSLSVSNNRSEAADGSNAIVKREAVYSNNYIQLTLDAARALENGDIEYANGCIDRIVSANENLLVEIADLGCNEEFIDFNLSRITTRQENLSERQNDLEFIDQEEAITLWKQLEALYNAQLQMSSQVVPNSIFNYMK